MEIMDWIALVGTGISSISICVNIIQRVTRKTLITTLKSRSQAAYNYFNRIAGFADNIRALEKSDDQPEKRLEDAFHWTLGIIGVTDAARHDIISYSREHLHFLPVKELPDEPYKERLPKPGKGKKL
jgi:hypothetical protein